MLSQKSQFSLLFWQTAKNRRKKPGFGVDVPIPLPPFAPGSGRLRRPSAAPEIRRADGFSVADSILGWSCQHCGGEGGRARSGRSPPHPGASLVRGQAGSGRVAREGAEGGTCPTPKLLLLFPTRAFSLGVCRMSPKPFWGESRLFLLSPYILHGASSCRIQEEQQGPAAGTQEVVGDPSASFPALQSICALMGVFSGFPSIVS